MNQSLYLLLGYSNVFHLSKFIEGDDNFHKSPIFFHIAILINCFILLFYTYCGRYLKEFQRYASITRNIKMNSYFIRRLTPFFIFSILIEFSFMVLQMVQNSASIDFSFIPLIKTIGVLLLTSMVSFLFVMLPYMLYLLVLPQNKQNSRLDKTITIFLYFIFVISSFSEEIASQLFLEEFSSAFNFIALNYFIYTNEVLKNLDQAFPIIWVLLGILASSIFVVALTYKYLFTKLVAPSFSKRLFQSVIYVFVCFLAYFNTNLAKIEINQNSYNNEIAREGTFSLFNSFHQNDAEYEKFYISHNLEQNLKILQKNLNGRNVTFIDPQKNITRQISSFRPEKRANVMVVMMKNMNSKYLESPYHELTPNLHKLAQKSLYFRNTYATGGRAARGVEAFTLSLPPVAGFSVMRSHSNQNIYNIGSIFKTKGYENKWIYGGYGFFEHMDEFFASNGFEIVDRSNWRKNDTHYANFWGAADEDIFNKAIREADSSFTNNKPFFTIMMTLSNHHPYTFPDGRIEPSSDNNKRHNAIKYADFAIGEFIKNIENKPWFDNTFFVFMSDQTSSSSRKKDAKLEDYRVPLMIYAPQFVKAKQIETKISMIDAAPTLLGLLDFNYESRFYGQDALQSTYKSRIFIGGYQNLGYMQDGVSVILSPAKQYTAIPTNANPKIVEKNLNEAVAYYQQASDWIKSLKE